MVASWRPELPSSYRVLGWPFLIYTVPQSILHAATVLDRGHAQLANHSIVFYVDRLRLRIIVRPQPAVM